MDYTHLLNELNKATTFDLFRLHAAISKELDNPKRIAAIKRKLRIGDEVSCFYPVENRLVLAKIAEFNPKTVVVSSLENGRHYKIPYCMLNVEHVDVSIQEPVNTKRLSPNTIKVGDLLGFDKEGENIEGRVKRINQKTVTLETPSGQSWRVSYLHLYRVHPGQKNRDFQLEQA